MGKDSFETDSKVRKKYFFKDNTNNHLEYEEWIPEDLPRVYFENYKYYL